MIIARCAVYGAVLVTMYFNGMYAWSKGGAPMDQYAMLAFALSIDGCKASFLRAASLCWRDHHRAVATSLFVLWWPCFAYSTFAGFSYLHTNRAVVSSDKVGHAQERQRAQTTYDQAGADLKLAITSPHWAASASCTLPPKGKGKEFCDGVARLKTTQASAAAILTRITPTDANPEVSGLASTTGLTPDRVQNIIALVSAILIELLASVGFYAIGSRINSKGSSKPVGRPWFRRHPRPTPTTETLSVALPVIPTSPSKPTTNSTSSPTPFRLTIPRASAPPKSPS
jgi:hypothetical protein